MCYLQHVRISTHFSCLSISHHFNDVKRYNTFTPKHISSASTRACSAYHGPQSMNLQQGRSASPKPPTSTRTISQFITQREVSKTPFHRTRHQANLHLQHTHWHKYTTIYAKSLTTILKHFRYTITTFSPHDHNTLTTLSRHLR